MLILEPGLTSTIQDGGRHGSQALGITTAGALDEFSRRCANRLVGNPREAAVLEIVGGGWAGEAEENLLVVVTGARVSIRVNGQTRPSGMALFVRIGSRIEVGLIERGRLAYLAAAGGFDTPPVLGSRSTDLQAGLGGYAGRALRPGDRIPVGASHAPMTARAGALLRPEAASYLWQDAALRVLSGPHTRFFRREAWTQLLKSDYTVSPASDRMAYRLSGETIPRETAEVLSAGTVAGAIQVPADGQPIVLLADRQTVGGYPILGCVVQADLPRLSQKLPGEIVRFAETVPAAAFSAWVAVERLIEECVDQGVSSARYPASGAQGTGEIT